MERIGAVLLLLVLALPTQAAVEMFYLHNDHLGTPRVVTNQQQEVVWKGHLKPFGETQVEIETITYHRRFPGQRWDIESRLHYNYFRDYDPRTGRYIQSDPIGLRGGINTYAYVAGNPINATDPYGLDCVAVGGTVTCNVPGGGPTITFPRPPDWPDKINPDSSNYHYYNIPVPLNGANPLCVMQGIALNPTPGASSGATPNGTLNNATPSGAQTLFNGIDYLSSFGNDSGGYNNSPVKSYLLNNGSVVVNVTLPGHPLHPGYVARDVNSGQVNNRGEGTGFLQGPFSPVSGIINGVWNGQTGGIVSSCSCP